MIDFDLTPEDRQDLDDAAKLSPVEWGLVRHRLSQKIAERHDLPDPIPLSLLDAEVVAFKNGNHAERTAPQGAAVVFEDPKPWPEDVDGAELLNNLAEWVASFMDMPHAAADAAALWAAATWFVERATFAPLLIITSPTKRGGKTRLLNCLRPVVRRPYRTSGTGATAAVVFRLNEAERPTFLIDEAERLSRNDDAGDLIGLLNEGFQRGGNVARCEKGGSGRFEVRSFDAFGYRALAAIGSLADTLQDRAVTIRLQRAPKSARIRRVGDRVVTAEGQEFARRFVRWAECHGVQYEGAEERAPRPARLDDRAADVWAPLFAVAALAEGSWPERAKGAALALSTGEEADDSGAGIALLASLRDLFCRRGMDRLSTADILREMATDEEAPTGRGGRELMARDISRILKPFGIRPKQVRFGDGDSRKGYLADDFEEAWKSYLPSPLFPGGGSDPKHPKQSSKQADDLPFREAKHRANVSDREKGESPLETRVVSDVSDNGPLFREERL